MLPANPQSQSLAQAPNRAMGSAVRAGSRAVASASTPTTGAQATPAPTKQTTPTSAPGVFGGTGYQRQCAVGGVIIACVPSNPAPGNPPGSGAGGGGGCNPAGFIATQMNPLDRVGPNPCGGGGGGGGSGVPCTSSMNPTPCVAFNASCPGALSPNTTTDGTNQHNSQISNVLSFWFDQPSGNFELAYEYQTYGGQEYIQFNYTISVAIGPLSVGTSVGPLYHMNGSWFATLQSVLNDVHKTTKDLPPPYNALSQDSAHELPCATNTQG